MSSGRFPAHLVLGVLLACGPAAAQEPAAGEASSWTDPPARTAPQEPPKSEAPVAPEPKRPEPARTERAPDPAKYDATRAERRQPQPSPAELRQEQIRRAVARSTAEREAEAARAARTMRRSVAARATTRRLDAQRLADRPQRVSGGVALRPRERQASLPRSLRRPVYGYADPEPVYGRYEAGPPLRGRPVWADADSDDRARRIAQARSAGYLVMRSRSYAYPDGIVVRRFSPLGGDDIED